MSKFSIDTKKSVYEPIVVEIDGTEFPVVKINREIFKKVGEFDDLVRKGEPEAAFDRLILLLGKKSTEKVNKLELREVNAITNHIMSECYSPTKKKESPDGKNGKSPGENE